MTDTDASAVAAQAGKYLTFKLGDEGFGLEIVKAQEIIGIMEVTRVPRTPEFVRGVINLRGKVIPVIDLRLKFGLPPKEDTARTCIIVVQVTRDDKRLTMGTIVDEVSEVLDISADQIDPAPEFGRTIDTAFILGMGKIGSNVIMLLDVDKVLSGNEVGMIDEMKSREEQ